MTPLSFEWAWRPDYFVFMGLLYLALTIIGIGVVYTILKTWLDLKREDILPEIPERKNYSKY